MPRDVLGRALGDDAAAVDARARAHVDEPVGRAHRLLVVLDDDHGVADVAQALERRDQPRVVALVEADRRLVEDVEHADEARADLRRQPDALRLAARERARRAIEREVADADVVEERQPLADLADHALGDQPLGVGQLELAEVRERLVHGAARDVVDVVSADRHGERLGPQSRAAAGRARAHRHERLDALLLQLRLRLAVAPLEVRDDALEGGHVRALAPVAVLVRHVHALAARAVQVQVLVLARELPPRPVERDFPAVGDRLEHLLEEARARRRSRARARRRGSRARGRARPAPDRPRASRRGRCRPGTRRVAS